MSADLPGTAAASPIGLPGTSSGVDPVAVRTLAESLGELAGDASLPRNVRRGAQEAKAELERGTTALDLRIAGAVYRLDDLANDPNVPSHGRTAIWSLISRLESLQ